MASEDDDVSSKDDLECRICRGSAEEGRDLFMPCRCRGSIMYCHEDCLVQWLEHSKKDRCEVCGYTFEFAPVYASDAPERVSVLVMMSAGARFLATRALPLLARILLSAALWLVAAPLATCVLYRAWVHRPSDQPVSWTARRLAEELGSGLVIAVAIVVSFLSLLSFTDYMRVRWELMEMEVGAAEQNRHEQNIRRRREDEAQQRERPPVPPVRDEEEDDDVVVGRREMRDEDDHDDDLDDDEDGEEDDDGRADAALNAAEEDEEIELHIAMDELLGLRGPVINVARNVSWLVVFNAAYLGLFAFIPFAVGSVLFSLAQSAAPNYALANDAMSGFAIGFVSTWTERRNLGHSIASSVLVATIDGSRRASEAFVGNTAATGLPSSPPPKTRPYASSSGRWLAAIGRLVATVASRTVSVLVRRRGAGGAGVTPFVVGGAGGGGSGGGGVIETVVNATTASNAEKMYSVSSGGINPHGISYFYVGPSQPLDTKTAMSFFESGLSVVARRLDSFLRALFDIGVSLGTTWSTGSVDSSRQQRDRSPPPTLRLDDLLKMGLGYVALGVVACAWRSALKAAPRWLRRRAPARALRRAEKALDAAAAAAKVAALLTLKMVLLPSILGAGLDAALSSHALFTVQASHFPFFESQLVAPSAVRVPNSNTTFIIHSPLTEYRTFGRIKTTLERVIVESSTFIPSVTIGHSGDLLLENYTSKLLAMVVLPAPTIPPRRSPTVPPQKPSKFDAAATSVLSDEEEDEENHLERIDSEECALDVLPEKGVGNEDGTRGATKCEADSVVPSMVRNNRTDGKDPIGGDVNREAKTRTASGVAAAVRELGGGALGVALCRWVLGITFMLVVTVAVLQLREVLHPAVLARHVRPHQHRPDLLATLLAEPAKAHARRLATSLAIYGALLAVAVAAPAVTYSAISGRFFDGPRPFFVLRFCYVFPRAQIPIELVIFHLCVLGLLERLKARLRDAQTIWLGFACKGLDLDGYFLPKLAPTTESQAPHAAAVAWERNGGGGRGRGGHRVQGNGRRHGNNDNHDSERRWAWGDEPLGPRERALGPRVAPTRLFGCRVAVLVVGSWLVMTVSTAFIMLGPIVLGRFVLDIFRVPQPHDPFALVVGWLVLLFVFEPWLDGSVPGMMEDNDELDEPRLLGRDEDDDQLRRPPFIDDQDLDDVAGPALAEVGADEANAETRQDGKWVTKVVQIAAFGLLWFVVAPLAIGVLYEVAVVASGEKWGMWQPPFSGSVPGRSRFPPLDWARDWVSGLFVLNTFVVAATRVVVNEVAVDAGREAQPQNRQDVDGQQEADRRDDRREDIVSLWSRAALRLHALLARESGLIESFDPLLLYDFALPLLLDVFKILLTPIFPTIYVASWLDPERAMSSQGERAEIGDSMAELGTRTLVAYRYSLAATVATSVAMTLIEPVMNW